MTFSDFLLSTSAPSEEDDDDDDDDVVVVVLPPDVPAGPRLDNDQLYKFRYRAEVLLDRARGSPQTSVGYRITSDVSVHLVWRDPGSKDDQLIQLAVGPRDNKYFTCVIVHQD